MLLLLLLLPPPPSAYSAPLTLHVSPRGDDAANGTHPSTSLASCAGVVRRISAVLNASELPANGIEVVFAAGVYPLNSSTACGILRWRATEAAPIVFRGDGAVLFDGTTSLEAKIAPIDNSTVEALINPSARGKIVTVHVPPTWGWAGGPLEWNGELLRASTRPNRGLAYVRRVFDPGAVYAEGRTQLCFRLAHAGFRLEILYGGLVPRTSSRRQSL